MRTFKQFRPRGRWAIVSVSLLLLLASVLGCSGSGLGGGGGFAYERVYGEGTAVQFTVRVSETSITTAEELRIELETRAGEQWRVAFPEVSAELGGFSVVERAPEDRRLLSNGTLVSTRAYRLEPFLPGEYTIPSLELQFGEPGTEFSFTLVSDEVDVEVQSELPPTVGEQDIEDIEEPRSLESRTWLWVAAGSGGVLLLAAAGALLIVRAKRRRSRPSAEPEKSPWVEARESLQALLSAESEGTVDPDSFYTELTGILRRYIERRFDVRAPEQTTEEFLEAARHSEALAPYREMLEDFLTHADLVKFAAYEPSESEVGSSIEACRSFVEATIPEGA
mgnify:CR=1 FL=1